MQRHGLDWSGSGLEKLANTCKCGNEPSGSIHGEFLDLLRTSELFMKDSAPWSK